MLHNSGIEHSRISSSDTGWIDLFGWGTSGFDGKFPYLSSNANASYGNGNADIAGTNYDWGVYNAIYNPKTATTDSAGTWRTLTSGEWTYLMNSRTTNSGVRYAKATVGGVSGIVVAPDDWDTATYRLDSVNISSATYSANVIALANWSALENAGCVFLPASGTRSSTTVTGVGFYAAYYTSTFFYGSQAYRLYFENGMLSIMMGSRFGGSCVRLVKDAL